MKKQLVIASNNPKKVREFTTLFQPLGFIIHSQSELGVPECPEPHSTFIENALAKARHASAHTGLPALADDSGLCVEILNDAPGAYSARYATQFGQQATDKNNNLCLLEQLKNAENRRAFYYCVLVYIRSATDALPVIAEGFWHGEILTAPKGLNGFGYDPIFYIPSLKQSVAELDPAAKNTFSHRAQALTKLAEKLQMNSYSDAF